METVTALIPHIGPHPDTAELVQLPPLMGACPKACIFLQLAGASLNGHRFQCAMAEDMHHGLDEIIHSRDLMQQTDRWPGPTGVECPAGLGFDGRMLYLNPDLCDPE
jgi:hypothetical protein